MILFKDIVTGDGIFTDAYKYKLVDDLYYHINAKFVKDSDDGNYDIGGNPSEEESAEALETTVTTGIDVCLQNRLVDSTMTKAQYKKHIKTFSQNLVKTAAESDPARADFLKKNLPKAVQSFLENFDDYSLFVGESFGEGAVVVFCKYPENCVLGCNIDVYVWKDAIEPEKF